MKLLVFVLVITLLGYSLGKHEIKITDEVIKVTTECAEENKIDLSIFEKSEEVPKEVEDSHDFKCFGKCIAEKLEMMDTNGNINISKMKEHYVLEDPSVLDKAGDCKPDMSIADACLRSHKVGECLEKLFD